MTGMDAAQGGCLCGAVRYRITRRPSVTVLCHCRSCRLASGGPTLGWLILDRAAVSFSGEPRVLFASSPGTLRGFCGKCGTALSYEDEGKPETIDITTATLDDPSAFPPSREIWLEHKIAWQSTNGAIDHYARSSRGAQPLPKPV